MKESRGTKTPARVTWWSCPRLTKGPVYVVANGPSAATAPLDLLRDKTVIAVNSAARLVPWARLLFFGDSRWWWDNRSWAADYPAEKVTLSRYWVEEDGTRREPPCDHEPGVLCMRQKGMTGLCIGPDSLAWNASSGGAAINLAAHANGCRRIVLVGFDMRDGPGGERNAVPNVRDCSRRWDSMNNPQAWKMLHAAALDRGGEILNATPDSAITEFPRVRLEDVV